MFQCPSCGEIENTVSGAGDYEQFFGCGACGYHEATYTGPFEIVTDPGDPDEGIRFTLKPVTPKTLEATGHLINLEGGEPR